MKPKFWLDLWHRQNIGFHQAATNQLLVEYWPYMHLQQGDQVFVPLCGKSLDMRWLGAQHHNVLGVELAKLAIESYFEDANESATTQVVDRFVSYRHEAGEVEACEILHGDFFDLTGQLLHNVRAVYDRGALVALPPDMRFRYVDHLLRIVPDETRILLLVVEYDQNLVAGPPHSVLPEEVERLYGSRCDIQLVDSIVTSSLPPKFAEQGVTQAAESAYIITKMD